MYCAMNSRVPKGFSKNGFIPLNKTNMMQADIPYAALSHWP